MIYRLVQWWRRRNDEELLLLYRENQRMLGNIKHEIMLAVHSHPDDTAEKIRLRLDLYHARRDHTLKLFAIKKRMSDVALSEIVADDLAREREKNKE